MYPNLARRIHLLVIRMLFPFFCILKDCLGFFFDLNLGKTNPSLKNLLKALAKSRNTVE